MRKVGRQGKQYKGKAGRPRLVYHPTIPLLQHRQTYMLKFPRFRTYLQLNMSGAEVIGLIDACIGITTTILEIGRAVRDAQGLPPTLRDLCEKLPAIEDLLETARERCEDGKVNENSKRSAKPILKQCEQALTELRDVFRKACPKDGDHRSKRIWRGARTVFFGRDGQVQKLLISVQDNLWLLEQKEVFRIGDRLNELQKLTEALAPDDHGGITMATRGGVHINYLMSGSGRQINNAKVYNEAYSCT